MVTSANAHERPVRSDAQPQRRRRRSSGGREPAPARKADAAGNRTTTPDRASPDRQPLPRPAREHAPADGRKGAAPLDWNDQPPASPEPGSGRRSSRRRSWTAQKRRPGAAAGALLVGILAFGAVVAVRSLDPQSPSGGGQLSATASDPLLASVQPLALTIAGWYRRRRAASGSSRCASCRHTAPPSRRRSAQPRCRASWPRCRSSQQAGGGRHLQNPQHQHGHRHAVSQHHCRRGASQRRYDRCSACRERARIAAGADAGQEDGGTGERFASRCRAQRHLDEPVARRLRQHSSEVEQDDRAKQLQCF